MLDMQPLNHKLSGHGEKILVVDDSRETVRHLAETLLPTFGFNSIYALDGRTALERIRADAPDLVMLDLNLPHMTGIDVLQALALDENRPPVVLMTGGGSEQSAIDAFRLGVKDYLVKPFTIDEVLETIQRTLERSENSNTPLIDEQQLEIARNEIRRQKDQFGRLLTISKQITALTDLNTIIDRTLRLALEECEAEQSTLWLPASERSQIHTYQYKLEKNAVYNFNHTIQDPFMQRVLNSGELVREADFSDGLNVGLERRARSVLYVPIKIHLETVGVLGVTHTYAPHAFSELDEMFLSAIGEYVSIALTNAFNIQKSRSSNAGRIRDLYSLVNITNSLATDSADKVIRDALFYTYNRWQIEACSVWKVEGKRVKFMNNMGVGSDSLTNIDLPAGEGFVGYVTETGKWIYSNAVTHHPRHHGGVDEQTGFQTRSILCIPLTYQGNVLGALQLINRMDGDFVEKDVEQAMSVGSILAIALHLMQGS